MATASNMHPSRRESYGGRDDGGPASTHYGHYEDERCNTAQLQRCPEKWSISYKQLMDVRRKAKRLYSKAEYSTKTMRDIVKDIVTPVCTDTGASYALYLNMNGLKADVFVSHAWAEPFDAFVASIENAFRAWVEKPNLWICSFALVQGDYGVVGNQLDGSLDDVPFVKALKRTNEFLVVRNSEVDLYSRIWCVCEAIFANKFKKRTMVTGPTTFSGVTTSVLSAKSFNTDDMAKILKFLLTQHNYKEIDEIVQKFRSHDSHILGNEETSTCQTYHKSLEGAHRGDGMFGAVDTEVVVTDSMTRPPGTRTGKAKKEPYLGRRIPRDVHEEAESFAEQKHNENEILGIEKPIPPPDAAAARMPFESINYCQKPLPTGRKETKPMVQDVEDDDTGPPSVIACDQDDELDSLSQSMPFVSKPSAKVSRGLSDEALDLRLREIKDLLIDRRRQQDNESSQSKKTDNTSLSNDLQTRPCLYSQRIASFRSTDSARYRRQREPPAFHCSNLNALRRGGSSASFGFFQYEDAPCKQDPPSSQGDEKSQNDREDAREQARKKKPSSFEQDVAKVHATNSHNSVEERKDLLDLPGKRQKEEQRKGEAAQSSRGKCERPDQPPGRPGPGDDKPLSTTSQDYHEYRGPDASRNDKGMVTDSAAQDGATNVDTLGCGPDEGVLFQTMLLASITELARPEPEENKPNSAGYMPPPPPKLSSQSSDTDADKQKQKRLRESTQEERRGLMDSKPTESHLRRGNHDDSDGSLQPVMTERRASPEPTGTLPGAYAVSGATGSTARRTSPEPTATLPGATESAGTDSMDNLTELTPDQPANNANTITDMTDSTPIAAIVQDEGRDAEILELKEAVAALQQENQAVVHATVHRAIPEEEPRRRGFTKKARSLLSRLVKRKTDCDR